MENLIIPNSLEIKRFTLFTPQGYRHAAQMQRFRTENEHKFYRFRQPNDAVYFQTDELERGKAYECRILALNESATLEYCFAVMCENAALFSGAEGLSIAWEFAKELFPVSKWVISLPRLGSIHREKLPLIYRYSDGDWRFNFGGLGDNSEEKCLLLISKVKG